MFAIFGWRKFNSRWRECTFLLCIELDFFYFIHLSLPFEIKMHWGKATQLRIAINFRCYNEMMSFVRINSSAFDCPYYTIPTYNSNETTQWIRFRNVGRNRSKRFILIKNIKNSIEIGLYRLLYGIWCKSYLTKRLFFVNYEIEMWYS